MSASKRPYIVGLTGGIATGKTVATNRLRELGACCIDADEISRAMTSRDGALLEKIRARFGGEVFLDDGQLNRRALAERIFSDDAERLALESITHPAIQRAMMDEVDRAGERGEPLTILSVPLLFETGMDALCDEIWLLSVERDMQLARLMLRDGLTEEQALLRIDSQMPLEDKRARATVVIDNARSEEKMLAEISSLYASVRKRAERRGEE